jgi:hypothetical protein
MAARPKRIATKALQLACWNANGIRGRKQVLAHFLGQHGIDMSVDRDPPQVWPSLPDGKLNYVCHRNNRLTAGGGTVILVCRGINYHAVPTQGLQHLEANAIQVKMGSKPVRILAVYMSPSRPCLIQTCLPPLAEVSPSSWQVT